MTILRPAPTTRPSDDLEDLLDFVIDIARRQIDSRGKCAPFTAVKPADGLPMLVSVDTHGKRLTDARLIEASFEMLAEMNQEIVAYAVVWIADITNEKTVAIRVNLEHVASHACIALVPFLRRPLRRETDYGKPRLYQGRRRIWPR